MAHMCWQCGSPPIAPQPLPHTTQLTAPHQPSGLQLMEAEGKGTWLGNLQTQSSGCFSKIFNKNSLRCGEVNWRVPLLPADCCSLSLILSAWDPVSHQCTYTSTSQYLLKGILNFLTENTVLPDDDAHFMLFFRNLKKKKIKKMTYQKYLDCKK